MRCQAPGGHHGPHPHTPTSPPGLSLTHIHTRQQLPLGLSLTHPHTPLPPGLSLTHTQDYFQDVKVWLPDYFYCKFVKETLHTLTGLYVMQLRRYGASSGSGHYEGAIAAARKVRPNSHVIIT